MYLTDNKFSEVLDGWDMGAEIRLIYVLYQELLLRKLNVKSTRMQNWMENIF
jgi:hypothetical protein